MKLSFTTELWIYPGDTAWHFVTIGREDAARIKERFAAVRQGFGSLPIEATIGRTTWRTSIFPSKDGT